MFGATERAIGEIDVDDFKQIGVLVGRLVADLRVDMDCQKMAETRAPRSAPAQLARSKGGSLRRREIEVGRGHYARSGSF